MHVGLGCSECHEGVGFLHTAACSQKGAVKGNPNVMMGEANRLADKVQAQVRDLNETLKACEELGLQVDLDTDTVEISLAGQRPHRYTKLVLGRILVVLHESDTR